MLLQCLVALFLFASAFINHVVSDDHYIPISYNNYEPSVNVSIGGQVFLVNLDTGSSNLAVPAQSCTMCTGPTYNPTTPSTACLSGTYTLPCGCTSGQYHRAQPMSIYSYHIQLPYSNQPNCVPCFKSSSQLAWEYSRWRQSRLSMCRSKFPSWASRTVVQSTGFSHICKLWRSNGVYRSFTSS